MDRSIGFHSLWQGFLTGHFSQCDTDMAAVWLGRRHNRAGLDPRTRYATATSAYSSGSTARVTRTGADLHIGSLIATRLLIGVFESGFYATAVAYLSTFYCRYDLAVRIAVFYGQYAVAGAFSGAIGNAMTLSPRFPIAKSNATDGALAYGVFQIGNSTLRNWQYLFVIEGSLTCLAAAMAWAWLPTGPGSAWFLADDERAFAEERIRLDNEPFLSPQHDGGQRLRNRDIVETIRDWKLWCILVFNICASVPSTAFSVFLPLIVQGMGFKALDANLVRRHSRGRVCGHL